MGVPNWAEWQYASLAGKGLDVRQGEFYVRRIEMAHRKLMAACQTLAKVKKAKLPNVLALVSVSPQVDQDEQLFDAPVRTIG